MSNVLSEEKRQQVLALGRLGWSLRRIAVETGVCRKTAGSYLKVAGVDLRPPGRWGRGPPKVANEVTTDFGAGIASSGAARPAAELATDPQRPLGSHCADFHELIEDALRRGRNAMGIYQGLVDDHGFAHSYESVKRYVRALRGARTPEAHPIITTAPGEEGQVDYGGDGPMVRGLRSSSPRELLAAVGGCIKSLAAARTDSADLDASISVRARATQEGVVESARIARVTVAERVDARPYRIQPRPVSGGTGRAVVDRLASCKGQRVEHDSLACAWRELGHERLPIGAKAAAIPTAADEHEANHRSRSVSHEALPKSVSVCGPLD